MASSKPPHSAESPLDSADRSPEPPNVYRTGDADDWIVDPAPHAGATGDRCKVFKGSQRALAYAYETYGNARFFPF